MSSDPNQQGQYPPSQWESQPPRGAYPPPPPGAYGQGPPPSQVYQQPTGTRSDMVTLPPPQQQHQDLYRHPGHDMYPGHPQDPYRGGPPQHMSFNQPAPRQRTAIACRYCRRRKIRCSGFEASEDGRCINCQRFQQECIFTPVSSQAQAFVPAHVAYPDMRNRGGMPPQRGGRPLYPQQGQPVIYGAHGQPLGPIPHQGQDPNYPPPLPQGYPMPSPTQPYPGHVYDDRGPPQPPHPQDQVSRKRPRSGDSPRPVVPPPPQMSSTASSHPYPQQHRLSVTSGGRRGSGGGFEYPDPTQLAPVSPASSSTSYHSAPYPQQPPQQQPYYPSPQQQQQQQPPHQPQSVRRSSPQSAYSYDARGSGSPQGSASSVAGYSLPGGLHPPQVLPPRDAGHTPPPQGREGGNGNGSAASRAGMSVRDMLGPGDQGGRTSTDSDMLKALNRRGM